MKLTGKNIALCGVVLASLSVAACSNSKNDEGLDIRPKSEGAFCYDSDTVVGNTSYTAESLYFAGSKSMRSFELKEGADTNEIFKGFQKYNESRFFGAIIQQYNMGNPRHPRTVVFELNQLNDGRKIMDINRYAGADCEKAFKQAYSALK